MAETISHIKIGNQEHPIDAVTINGLTLTSEEKTRWDDKQDALTFDSIPTENSENLVKSGVLYSIITENEEITAAAIVDINQRLVEISNLPAFAITSGSIDYWDNAVQGVTFNGVYVSSSYGEVELSETDPVFASSVAASITAADISNWNSKTSNTGTVTGSGLTTDKIVLGNNNSAIKTSTYSIVNRTPATGNEESSVPTYAVVVGQIEQALTSVLKYKGTIGTGGTVTSLPASHAVGDVYVVSTAGTFAGKACEVGDYIICKTAGTTANDAHWDVVNGENQVNNKSASLAAAGASVSIATIDGTDITISTPASWTGVDKVGTLTGITFNGSAATVSNGIVTISESDPVFSASAAAGISAADITNWNSKTSNTGTITGISMNGASKGTSGNVNLGTVVTAISFNGTAATISNGVASISAAVLPSVSSADSGKILQVSSNGSWALVTPVSIYNGSSAPNNANGNNGDIYIQTS